MKAVPKISVIIPCYNVEPWVGRCLDSVLKQTLQDIEIICIDDKSTDATAQILERIAEKDNRVRVLFHEKNLGAGAARNTGLEHATGEYIGFVDPDDYVDLDFYEKLYEATETSKAEIAKAGLWHTDSDVPCEMLNGLIKQNIVWFYGEYTTAIYKHSFLQENSIRFPTDVITGQDSVFLTNVVIYKPSINIINDTFYRYYRREGSLDSVVLAHKKVMGRLNMISHKINLIKSVDLPIQDFCLLMKTQVLTQINCVIYREFEIESDRDLFWECLRNIHKECGLKKEVREIFGKKILAYLCSRNYAERCNFYRCSKKKKIYLFNVIPIGTIRLYKNISWVKLFNFAPFLKCELNRNKLKMYCYLFGVIPVLKVSWK